MYSCSSSECKELLARLGWREVAQALDDPALVVTLTKFRQRASQFLDVLEHSHPQQQLLQRANGDRYKWSLRFTVINLTDKTAPYNFLSTFSGTHFVTPRAYNVELGFHF